MNQRQPSTVDRSIASNNKVGENYDDCVWSPQEQQSAVTAATLDLCITAMLWQCSYYCCGCQSCPCVIDVPLLEWSLSLLLSCTVITRGLFFLPLPADPWTSLGMSGSTSRQFNGLTPLNKHRFVLQLASAVTAAAAAAAPLAEIELKCKTR